MDKKFICFFALLFTLFHENTYCQTKEIDSLYKLIIKQSGDTNYVNHLNDLAVALIEEGYSDTAFYYCSLAAGISEKINYRYGLALALRRSGVCRREAKDYAKAFELMIKSKKIFEELKDDLNGAKTYRNIGFLFFVQENYSDAFDNFYSALLHGEKVNDTIEMMSNLDLISHIFRRQYSYEKALEYAQKWYALAYKGTDLREKDRVSQELGRIYQGLKNYPLSLHYHLESLHLSEVEKDTFGIGNSYEDLAFFYSDKEELEKSIEYHILAEKMYRVVNDTGGIANTYFNRAIQYKRLKKFDLVLESFLQSLKLCEMMKDTGGIADTYSNIGRTYLTLNKYDSALHNLQNALQFAKIVNVPGKIVNDYQDLSTVYEKINNTAEALKFQKLFVALKDSIREKDEANKIGDLEAKRSFENAVQQNKIQKAEQAMKSKADLAKKTNQRNILIAGLVVVLFFAFIVFRNLLRKKKDHDLISSQKKQVDIQNEIIKAKNRDITDNLTYAKRIQSAILPDIKLIYKTLGQSFILYIPKDIVSGDFYSFAQKNNKVIVAAADCTGHGVAGAFMSMIGSSLLNQLINEKNITEPALILDNLNEGIIQSLKQKESDSNDGMDISLCTFDLQNNILHFAGANRPLWLIRNGELLIYKPDKFPIGGLQIMREERFRQHEIKLQSNDTVYIFSDGYPDQFGGERGKKFMSKKFKELLLNIQNMTMREQENYLKNHFEKWKSNSEQVDDVLVIGIRV